MDDPSISIPINGEEGLTLTSLQIDCDLDFGASDSASLTLTSASTLTVPLTTTKSNHMHTGNGGGSSNNNNEPSSEWIELYTRLKRTPPKAACTAQFQDTLSTANELLKLSDDSDFQNKSFDNLTNDQKAILMLMIMNGMDKIFEGGHQGNAKILIKALHLESKEYKRMMSFVREVGDCPAPILLQQKALESIRKFENAPEAITIFKRRPKMSPFLHLQHENSYICAYNAGSGLLHYCSHNNEEQGENENDDEEIQTIKMNISRYVRDEVSGLEIANFTLTTVKGAYLKRVLLGLMKSFGTTDCKCLDVEMIATWADEDENFLFLKTYLNNGRPFVFCIECFPGLADKERLQYKGKVADHYVDISNKRPQEPKDRVYHALLCIGIKPRNGQTPPLLLVQDSCPFRPIFEIGLDLLMDMGLGNLDLCTVPKKWTFNKNRDYMASPETKALVCGSPMSVDDKGVPRIIKAEKPIQVQREDMSRYLDVVTVKRGEVIVVMT